MIGPTLGRDFEVTVGGRHSLGEWAVLGLLSEAPVHPFALARQLGREGPLGRVFTVRRPLVYRAVERLHNGGLVEHHCTEPGDSGPERTVYRVTSAGREELEMWLGEPVRHIRDIRLAFLLKIMLLRRAGRSPTPLVQAQQEALDDTLDGLDLLPGDPDEIDLWRHHNAAATSAFLEALCCCSNNGAPPWGGRGPAGPNPTLSGGVGGRGFPPCPTESDRASCWDWGCYRQSGTDLERAPRVPSRR